MRKKFFFVVTIFSVLFAFDTVHAWMLIPYFDITINKTAIGGDGNFNFGVTATSGSNPVPYINDEFGIETENGIGSSVYYSVSGDGENYYITEDAQDGWKNTGVVCNSDNPNVTFSPVTRGVHIVARSFSTVNCEFTNTKQGEKTPVLIVPGIMGTEMKKGEELLWADLGRMAYTIGDAFMDPLMFSENLNPVDVDVHMGQVIRNPENLYNYTDGLINDLQSQGYAEGTTATSTIFTFPYDWRYGVTGIFNDGKTNVDALKQKIADVRALTGSDKVDVIAHSTGGLLVKKYVMENPTDNHIGKVVFVGVPNLGAPKAVKTLIEGDTFNIPFLNYDEMKKISQNLPVAYELSPSEKYVTDNGSFVSITTNGGPISGQTKEELNFNQTKDYMATDHGLNLQAINNSQVLHSSGLDNFDIRSGGVDLYSLVGCKSGTLGKINEFRDSNNATVTYINDDVTGDGTVPMASANSLSVNDDHIFYAIKPEHGKMPSADGIRQKIVNIITGSTLAVGDKVISKSVLDSDPSKCQLTGWWFEMFSPVSIEITDQNGNRAGLTSDGSIENNIAGADYQVMGEHKFVFLPTDESQTYSVNLKGTGDGTFTFKNQKIENGQAGQTEAFINIPVTVSGSGQVNLGQGVGGGVTTLSFDATGSGNAETISPSAVLDLNQSKDTIAPISTSAVSGTKGEGNFYRSDVNIVLSAIDPIIVGEEGNTSGILETKYGLDGGGYESYNTAAPISVSAEDAHTLKFFSTDKAGNNEPEQTIVFTIDKTAPSINVISPTAKDYLRSDSIVINATSTDSGTGILSLSLAFDGKSVKTGDKIDLFYEKLGKHLLAASSTDFAGNYLATSTALRIVATPESVISDIERAYSLGWITKKQIKETLVRQIKAMVRIEKRIETMEEKLKNGKKKIVKIERMVERIDKVLAKAFHVELKLFQKQKFINAEAHELLQEDIKWLLEN